MENFKILEFKFPETKEELMVNLENWDELDTESKAVTVGQMRKMYGVPPTEEARKLVIADIKGEISTKMKKDLAMMVEPLSIDIEDDGVVYLEYAHTVMAINENVLSAINMIVEVKKQDKKVSEKKNKALNAIANNEIDLTDVHTIEYIVNGIIDYTEGTNYHKVGVWAACTSFFKNQDIDLEDGEQRSDILNRLNKYNK